MKLEIKKIGNIFVANDEKTISHLVSKYFGTFNELKELYVLDPFEVLYLFEKKSQVSCIDFEIESVESFLAEFSLDLNEYLVFCDLQSKGYLVKQALKFGATFRIYQKINKGVETHASHLVFVSSQKKEITPEELFSINRVAHSSKKKVLLAYVDYELSVSYLEQSRWN